VKEWLTARHRGLFIRSYVVLAGGLLVAAMVLDLGFEALQSRHARPDPWLSTTLRFIEKDLLATAQEDRERRAGQLADELGLGVDVHEAGERTAASITCGIPRR
jgi:hypothetical protein